VLYRIGADSVVVLHFLWVVFLIFGSLIGRYSRPVKITHISGLFFSVILQIFGWYCPLSHLEVWLRQKQDPFFSHGGSFLIHYLEKLIYRETPPWIIFFLTVILVIMSMYVYSRPRRED
jgi:uncharacterized membrane protein (UPF0136 family)